MKFILKLLGIRTAEEKLKLDKEFACMKEGLKNKVSGLTKQAVQLSKTKTKTKSRIGGKPVVDEGEFIWPSTSNGPMSFLAQLDLNEISNQLKYDWLGDSGSLLFFYDTKEMPWGFDPKDKGKWKVMYQKDASMVVDYPEGQESQGIYKDSYLEARRVELLPSFEDSSIQNLNLSDEEMDLYIELDEYYEEFDPFGEQPVHQVGGFPRPVQGDEMQFEAQQASEGVYMGDGKAYQKANAADFELAKQQWQLLLQIDSDEELGMMWGDVGTLYFWVEKDKSLKNNFQDVWLILQCT